MLLVVGPALIADNFIGTLMETGEGSGAISVVLIGMGGGFAISGRGAGWARVVAGLLAFGVIGGVMVFMFYFKDQAPTPSATFGGIYLAVLLVWLAVGCSVPMRKLTMRKLTSDNSSRPTVRNSVP
jgi:hypothetical protein